MTDPNPLDRIVLGGVAHMLTPPFRIGAVVIYNRTELLCLLIGEHATWLLTAAAAAGSDDDPRR